VLDCRFFRLLCRHIWHPPC